MTEEANLNKLQEENQAIRARMEAAEEKAQMAKNEVNNLQH
jgi:outer membrane murein-binding lipoprotein Lpp